MHLGKGIALLLSVQSIVVRIEMRVMYLGENDPLSLLYGKIHDVISVEKDWYRIVDETDEDSLYLPQLFKIITQ